MRLHRPRQADEVLPRGLFRKGQMVEQVDAEPVRDQDHCRGGSAPHSDMACALRLRRLAHMSSSVDRAGNEVAELRADIWELRQDVLAEGQLLQGSFLGC